MGIFDFLKKGKKSTPAVRKPAASSRPASPSPAVSARPARPSVCQFYQNGMCVAGGQQNRCSANPSDNSSCFVYQYHSTGDVSVLYGPGTRIVGR